MKLGKLYSNIIKFGLETDLRSKKEIEDDLKRVKKTYDSLKPIEKKYFDKDKLKHPYSDSRVLYGDLDKEIKTIMVGVDMEVPELILADRLREKNTPVDLVMAHHPEGKAISNLGEVMHLQKDILAKFGLDKNISVALMDERIGEVSRSISSSNHTRSVDAARILDIPFMCCHTPSDNHVAGYLQGIFDKKRPKKVKDIMNILEGIPEYQLGMENQAGPVLIAGKEKNDAGKVFVDMTGGTEGAKNIYARLSQAGVGTIVGMHFSEGHYKNAKAEHLNVIIAGHISSDILGLNLLFDNLEKIEKFNIIECSGFKRIRHT